LTLTGPRLREEQRHRRVVPTGIGRILPESSGKHAPRGTPVEALVVIRVHGNKIAGANAGIVRRPAVMPAS
jgi:hypothetical protein